MFSQPTPNMNLSTTMTPNFERNRPGLPHNPSGLGSSQQSWATSPGQSPGWGSSPSPAWAMSQGPSQSQSAGMNASTSASGGDYTSFNSSSARPAYLPGYLMSATQGLPLPDGAQRFDDPPLLPTKSQSQMFGARGAPATFGTESSPFGGSRSRKSMAILDDDAPPTTSVYDVVDQVYPASAHKALQRSGPDPQTPRASHAPPSSQIYTIIVFGYPPDKYKAAAQLFVSLGETTHPEPGPEGSNWFSIGFKNSWEVARAVRKNGELMQGTWMIGAKWADAAQAEAIMMTSGSNGRRNTFSPSSPSPVGAMDFSPSSPITDSPQPFALTSAPSFGKAITLAPSTAAFKKQTGASASHSTGEEWAIAEHERALKEGKVQPRQESGVISRLSDLIFGW